MKRWAKRVGVALLAAVGVVLLTVVGVWIHLHTEAGGALLRRSVLAAVNGRISGTLRLGEVDLRGTTLSLRSVALSDPEGEVVAEVEEVRAEIALLALLGRTVRMKELALVRPELWVVRHEDGGTNLQAALAPRHPKPEQPEEKVAPRIPVDVIVEAIAISKGRVSFEQLPDAKPRSIVATDLTTRGAFALTGRGGRLDATFTLEGALTEPAEVPLALDVHATAIGDNRSFRGRLMVADARADVRATMQGAGDLALDVDRLELPPAPMRELVEGWPLIATLRATAHLEKQGGDLRGRTHLEAGAGKVDASGQLNLDTFESNGVRVVAGGIDLSELIAAGPKSAIGFTLEAHGGGHSMETLTGALSLRAPASTIDGAPFGPIRLDARAEQGRMLLEALDARVPGMAITARGERSQDRLHVFGRMAANDLRAFARTLGKLAGPRGLPLSGNGAVAFEIDGPEKGPKVTLRGRLPALTFGRTSVRALELDAEVPNVMAPLVGDATIRVGAARVFVSGKEWRCPELAVTSKRGRFTLGAGTRGFASVELRASGTIDGDRRGLSLSRMRLRSPGTVWTLEHTARLRLDRGALSLRGLVLRSGQQGIALDVTRAGARVDAGLHVSALRLEKLPRALVDPELQLGGVLDLDARVSGRFPKPEVVARVTLKDGRVKRYGGIALALDGSWKHDRALGNLDVTALGVHARGDFDVPTDALRTARAEPLRARLAIDDAAIGDVFAQLGEKAVPLRGRVGATLELDGTARLPKLTAQLGARELTWAQQPPVDLDILANTRPDGRLSARVDAQTQGRSAFVVLETPWTLGRLIRRPPTAEQALHAAWTLKAKLDGLPIPAGAFLPDKRTGDGPPGARRESFALLDGDIDLKGPPLAPEGRAEWTLRDVRLDPAQPPLRAWMRLVLHPRRAQMQARIDQGPVMLARAEASLDASLATLRSPQGRATAPFTFDATWGPIRLTDLRELHLPLPFSGIVQGTLKASGDATRPEVDLEASIHGLGSTSNASLGDVALHYAYSGGRNSLSADLLSGGSSGRMTLTAQMPLDLSLPALRRGIPWREAPIQARIEASRFDPSFLSGLSPALRKVAGAIDARVSVQGPISLPHVEGLLEWREGALALAGYGAWDHIHLRMRGDEQQVVIEDASAHAGRGTATLSATLRRARDAVDIDVKTRLQSFPVFDQDQLIATVTLEATAKGTASLARIDLPDVQIPEAHVELPASKKNVAKLQPPDDVVFLVNGEPVANKPPERAVGGSGRAGNGSVRQLRAVVHAPRNVWFRGRDLNVEVGLGEDFRVQVDEEPMLFGDVRILRGQLEVVGRGFELDPASKITFTGPPTRPTLNVVATHENRREDVTVSIQVTGSPDHLELHPTSKPPLSETEIYTLLVTGRRALRPGLGATTSSNPATSLIGSLAAAQLKKGIESVVPLQVLNIEAGERGLGGTRVEAGTYLSDRLYLSIESTLGAQRDQRENQNEIHAEYQLWKRFLLELTWGDANKGSGDLIWRKQY